MKTIPFRYNWMTYRRDQFWLPAGMWGLFLILIGFFMDTPNQLSGSVRGYLGMVIPLMSGILAAYALLDDPGLELQFSTPRTALQRMADRLGIVFLVSLISAMLFQVVLWVLGVDISFLGSFFEIQMAWFIPVVAMIGLGSLLALAFTKPTGGALFVGIIWIFQLMLRGWFAWSPWARYIYLYLGVDKPGHESLVANQLVLAGLSLLFLFGTWMLLKKQERYI
jgi:hypothetical protein